MPLSMTKIAFGAQSAASLREWLESHASLGEARLTTRYMPKRHEEMASGSLYWIFNKAIIGRSPLLGFMDNGQGRTWIRIEPRLIAVQSIPRRAHQGWRYLEEADAPADLGEGMSEADMMPAEMLGELARLGLV
ncbi:DUF1489 domain-containing protein [Blastomonas sp.]|uniref:DUF1489 family protein n=1 Tax=Blastomonas sp. TaxID=1909299 RepID=UPI002636D0D7|nr:DUF1489 domain-containing protein [Blastomonas sp.]MDM7957373.1 DUF1489 domain-containing protein [Blastomonas sp.]